MPNQEQIPQSGTKLQQKSLPKQDKDDVHFME